MFDLVLSLSVSSISIGPRFSHFLRYDFKAFFPQIQPIFFYKSRYGTHLKYLNSIFSVVIPRSIRAQEKINPNI